MALILNGVDQYAQLNRAFGASNAARSLYFWVKTVSAGNGIPVSVNDASSIFSFSFFFDDPDQIQARGRIRTATSTLTAYSPVSSGSWTPCLLVYDGQGSLSSYVGVDNTTGVSAAASPSLLSFDNILIGARNDQNASRVFFSGSVAVVREWGRDVSSAEITALMGAQSVTDVDSVSSTGLQFSDDLIETSDESVTLFGSTAPAIDSDSPFGPSTTINDIDGDESVYPGQSFVITGTNFGATQGTGTVDIDGVVQTVTAWSDTSITCTAVRGGNEYGTGKTLTVTTDAATTATLAVAQKAEPGTFAVTAASPNTTDDASLWSGLVDTATGNRVTVVDGDQAWVKDPNNLGTVEVPFSITPSGEISAGNEGSFVVQFRRSSEGVWGSDQTVSFTLPVEAEDNWPYHKNIRYRAGQTWAWGSRHPKTGMRVRIFNE